MKSLNNVVFLSVLILVACAGGTSSISSDYSTQTSTASSASNAEGSIRVSEMMAALSGENYSLNLQTDGELTHWFKFDGGKVEAFFAMSAQLGYVGSVFLDYRGVDIPWLYLNEQTEGGTWTRRPANNLEVYFFESPLTIFDTNTLADPMFQYDASLEQYMLKNDYFLTVLGEYNAMTVENFIVKSVDDGFTITLQGEDPETAQAHALVFSYVDIGTTEVTLPVVVDAAQVILETVLPQLDNYAYLLIVNTGLEGTEMSEGFYSSQGTRDGDHYRLSSVDSLLTQIGVEEDRYFAATENGYELISVDTEGTAILSGIDAETFEALKLDFQPIRFDLVDFEDLEESGESLYDGWPIYHLAAERISTIFTDRLPLLEGSVWTDAKVSVYQEWSGTQHVYFWANATLGDRWYQIEMILDGFDATVVDRPYLEQDALTLTEMIYHLISTQSYVLAQTAYEGGITPRYDTYLSREGNTFKIQEPNNWANPASYFDYQEGVYRAKVFNGLTEEYDIQVITEEAYLTETIDRQWFRWDMFQVGMIDPFPDQSNAGALLPSAYASIIALVVPEGYAIATVELSSVSYEDYNALHVELEAENIQGNAIRYEAVYTDVGLTEVPSF